MVGPVHGVVNENERGTCHCLGVMFEGECQIRQRTLTRPRPIGTDDVIRRNHRYYFIQAFLEEVLSSRRDWWKGRNYPTDLEVIVRVVDL
jgi:hypothetical protein